MEKQQREAIYKKIGAGTLYEKAVRRLEQERKDGTENDGVVHHIFKSHEQIVKDRKLAIEKERIWKQKLELA